MYLESRHGKNMEKTWGGHSIKKSLRITDVTPHNIDHPSWSANTIYDFDDQNPWMKLMNLYRIYREVWHMKKNIEWKEIEKKKLVEVELQAGSEATESGRRNEEELVSLRVFIFGLMDMGYKEAIFGCSRDLFRPANFNRSPPLKI